MLLSGVSAADSFAQLITVLLIFVLVLGLTWYTTRWIARYQKGQKKGSNIDVVETCPVGNGKYIQIIRLAETYVAVAVCKDTVTLLAEIPKDQLTFSDGEGKNTLSFKELFCRAKSVYHGSEEETQEDSSKEE